MNPLQYAHVECIFTFLSRPTYILEEDIDEDEMKMTWIMMGAILIQRYSS